MSDEQQLSEEEIMRLLGYGQENATLQRAMELQQKQAELMRLGSDAPEGQVVSGHYVAPSPLQYVGGLAKQYSAQDMQNNALGKGAVIDQNTGVQNQSIAGAILRAMGRSPQIVPQAGMGGAGMPAQEGYPRY
jgi:hypothetical protein